jgi:hypothetical protein
MLDTISFEWQTNKKRKERLTTICGNRLRESNELRKNMETIIEAQDQNSIGHTCR